MQEAHRQRVEVMNAEYVELPPHGTALDLLRLVYRSATLPLSTRMRAAMAAIPYETPRLAVVAQVTENSLAELLDRRLAKLKQMKNGNEPKPIEPPATPPPVEVKPPMPRLADRRYRRF